ncbi:PH domain-containing protein [Shewanella nanhaiensis]|uniref:PH domain-containing protein n=1 Tax=Shewanella nanhaiensis TaxID=2864872 RepID=A0ABS7DYJ9_9GAMM|nr:PH domain-containing protein [Shewanella nanhaiensis]MBW8182498.1 PH domain-containing protein [Shewanella nanhaiensis]
MSVQTSRWAGLSAWSIISYSFSTIRQVLTNGYAIIPFVYTGWQTGFNSPWLIIAIVGAILAVFAYATVQWAMFRYRLYEDKLGVRHGLIFKKANELPLSKIQNVRLEQPLYFRPMGLYSLVVETAGSKEDEAVLAAVNYERAIAIKQHLVGERAKTQQKVGSPFTEAKNQPAQGAILDSALESVQEQTQEQTLVTKGVKDLLLFGLYQNNLFWFSIIAGPILSQLDWSDIADTQLAQSSLQWYNQAASSSLLYQVLIITLLIIGFYLLLSLISMTAAVLKYYPYHLGLNSKTLHRTGGVIAKQNDALALHRVQVTRFSQTLIGRLLKLWTLHFKQVQGTEIEQKAKKHMLIPSMSRAQISELMPQIDESGTKPQQLPTYYNPIHFGWYWRRALLPLLIPLINTIGLGLNPMTEVMWAVGLALSLAIYLRYRQWGYRLIENTCWIHNGVLGQSWYQVPLIKVQHVAITQTSGQRKRGTATLELGLASGTQTIPYMPVEDAREIAERTLVITSKDPNNWI